IERRISRRTQNSYFSQVEEQLKISVFNKADWDQIKRDGRESEFLLLAIVSDLNIVPIRQTVSITPDVANVRLAYHDWVNPSNKLPTQEALNIKTLYPNGFVFFTSNVPTEIPLYDESGNLVKEQEDIYDQF